MGGGIIERFIFLEVSNALELKQACSHGIERHRILSDEETFVFGDEPSIKVMGSPVVKLSPD